MVRQNSQEVSAIRRLIVVRHGIFEGNLRSCLTKQAVEAVAEAKRPMGDFDDMGMLPEGRQMIYRAKRFIADMNIDACFYAPSRRTQEAAKILVGDRELPCGMIEAPGLRERNRGIFSFMPNMLAWKHPLYKKMTDSTLDWLPPSGPTSQTKGETLRQVMRRIEQVLNEADKIAPGGTVLFVTHAEAMIALRALPRILALTDNQLERPLISDEDIPASLKKARYISLSEINTFEWQQTPTASNQCADFFKIICTEPTHYSTGWRPSPIRSASG